LSKPQDSRMPDVPQEIITVSQVMVQPVTPHSREQVTRFFDGLDLIEPGVVPIQQWRPDSDAEAAARAGMWGGVGRKP
jgi:S-adenosyl methyltransferase